PTPDPTPTPTPTPTPIPTPLPSLPPVPQHMAHIRLAELAYIGTPLGAFERQLLQNYVDLVIPNSAYLNQINAVAPQTPQLIYTNFSNIYLDLLTDWLAYADRVGADREAGFYHVGQATPFTGDSASSVPVNRFWGVYGGSDGAWTDLTYASWSRSQTL